MASARCPSTSAIPRISYVVYGELGQDARLQPGKAGDELARTVINLSAPQLVHSATRGGGQRDYPDGGRHGIKAVIRHGDGLGSAYARPGPEGVDPIDKYVGCRPHLPPPSGPHGQPARLHELSQMDVMGSDLSPFEEDTP